MSRKLRLLVKRVFSRAEEKKARISVLSRGGRGKGGEKVIAIKRSSNRTIEPPTDKQAVFTTGTMTMHRRTSSNTMTPSKTRDSEPKWLANSICGKATRMKGCTVLEMCVTPDEKKKRVKMQRQGEKRGERSADRKSFLSSNERS